MTDLLSMYPEEIEKIIQGLGEKSFRAGQIFSWLHKGSSFEDMSNIPVALRNRLKDEYIAQPVSIMECHVSALDGTRKYLYRLCDGNCIEGVLMQYRYGYTLCVSTQVGCNMGCTFCASTLGGKVRDLTAGEILGQIICINNTLGNDKIHNVVLMGSGEPLDNYDNTVRFLRLVSHEKGLNIGLRHISLSTCGLVDRMLAFSREGLPVTLSVSLHAPNDDIRRQIMPVAKAYPVRDIIDACRQYVEQTGRRVIFEYALIRGINSDTKHAEELASLLRNLQCHVNLIPLNTVKERNLIGVNEHEIRIFLSTLEKYHISATRRREMGDDIDGACGQLRKHRLEEGNI